jgi:hypothetical protein
VLHRLAKRLQTEIARAGAAIHAVEEGGDFDQLAPGIHEVVVEHLLASHARSFDAEAPALKRENTGRSPALPNSTSADTVAGMTRRPCCTGTYGLAFLVALLVLVGCQTAYYGVMETFGIEKRDLLKKAVALARDEQKEAGVEFKDALTRLQELYGTTGTDLEKTYGKLKGDLESCESQAADVKKRIRDMDRVANDLFAEWEKEIGQFTNPTFASDSRRKLGETRGKYSQLASSLNAAEGRMEPVLKSFREHVLYLKHNLNAAAIGSLRGEATNIEAQIGSLLNQMNGSIAEAEAFIRTLN